MAAALNPPSPEAMAIIKEGTPKPQVSLPPVEHPVAAKPAPVAEPESKPVASRAKKEPEPESVGHVTLNCHISVELSTLLLKASSERKIKKIRPYTQKEIVAEALSDWLKKNG